MNMKNKYQDIAKVSIIGPVKEILDKSFKTGKSYNLMLCPTKIEPKDCSVAKKFLTSSKFKRTTSYRNLLSWKTEAQKQCIKDTLSLNPSVSISNTTILITLWIYFDFLSFSFLAYEY